MTLKRVLMTSAVLASCLWAPSALAQSQPADAAAADEADVPNDADIIVTAQFREQALQDTPLAITAVNAAMLEARGTTNIQMVGMQAPNVTLKPVSSSWGPSLAATIRGVGQVNFHPALEPGVGMFVDDVYYATLTGSMFDLVDVERVEVLRGPQGTLTGRNSIGGAIRVMSRTPTGAGDGYIEGTVGQYDLIGVRGSIDFALTDRIFARMSLAGRKQDGYVQRLDYGCANPSSGVIPQRRVGTSCELGAPLGGQNNIAGRGMLRFILSDDVEFLLSGDVVHEDKTGPAEVNRSHVLAPQYVCGKFCNYATYSHVDQTGINPTWYAFAPDPNTYYDGWGVSGKLTANLSDDLELLSITAYRKYTSQWSADGDLTPETVNLEHTWISHKFFSQEVRLNGKLSNIDYTVGGYYSRQDTLLRAIADVRPFIPLYDTNDPVPASTAAAFATVVVPVTSAFNVTAGIRFTHESKDYTFYRYTLTGAVVDPAFNGLKVAYSDSVVDYRLSLDYRWSDQIMTYLTYSTGFKGGGVNPVPSVASIALPFRPEKLTNFEGGIRTDLFGRRLRFNVSAFYNEYKDVLGTRLSCPELGVDFCGLVQNVGTAHNKGVEVELSAEPIDGLKINGSFSYLDFQYVALAPSTGLSLDIVPPYVPDHQWSLGASYRIDLGAVGSLTPRLDAFYQSHLYSNVANGPTNRIAPYTLVSGSLTWRNEAEDLSVALQVENLFDKYYILNNFDLEAFFGNIRDQPGRPRTLSLVARKRF